MLGTAVVTVADAHLGAAPHSVTEAFLAFLEQVTPQNVISRFADGVMIGCGPQAREAAEIARKHAGRKLPW